MSGEDTRRCSQAKSYETDTERRQRHAREALEREAARQKLIKEREEHERLIARQRALEEAHQAKLAEEEATKLLAEQKRRDLERLEKQLNAVAPDVIERITSPPATGKFKLFSRKRGLTKSTPPQTARSGSGSELPTVVHTRSSEQPKAMEIPKIVEPPKEPRSAEKGIAKGGGGIVPGTDAPISASNSGERVSRAEHPPGFTNNL